MPKLTPVTSALAALIIASALSGCGGGNVEPVSAPTSASDAQTTTDPAAASAEAAAAADATAAAEATSAADATKAAQEAAAAEAATAAKAASDAKAAADAKAKAAAAAAKAKAVAAVPVAKPAPAPAPKPAPAPAPAAAKTYANCTAMHVDYKGGVARPGAVDHRTSGHANYAPVYSQSLYDANKGSDRDGDGIACEA